LLLAPSSQGGGFAGVNGRIVAISGTAVDAVTVSDGTTTALVSSGAVSGDGASLSPDATRVAYVSASGLQVHCISGCTDYSIPLPSGATSPVDPAWSPPTSSGAIADERIAFAADVGGSEDIFIANADGTGTATDVASGAATDAAPSWSADGDRIAFASARAGGDEIWSVDVSSGSGGAQQQITSSSGSDDGQPAWSPDGKTIAFESDRSGSTNQIYTVPADGGSLTQLTSGATAAMHPVWSPDGTTIAFAIGNDVDTVPATGGTPTTVATLSSPETADWETLIPTNSVAPTVSAATNPIQGNVVTASHGTWQGASSYLYQFLRCDSDGFGCSAITSFSSSASYTLTADDVGHTIKVEVEGVDTAGASAAVSSSNKTAVVIGPGPTNIDPPTISLGTSVDGIALTQPHVGTYVTATVGRWTGSGNTYTYQWKKCDPKSGSCFDLQGATSSFYLPTNETYGYDLRVQVTAENDDGRNSVNSDPTDEVTADAPVNEVSPQISGQNTQGQTLRVGTGTWTGTAPLVFTYQWRRCDPQGSLSSCVAIPGATTPSYTLAAADVGLSLRAYVTATNVTGPVTAVTNHTFPTLPAPSAATGGTNQATKPANTGKPVISGTTTVGTALLASKGIWSGQAPLAYRYAWQRCDALGSGCRPIAKAHRASYKLVAADLGDTIRVAVTVSNKLGKATALSAATGAVSLGKPLPRGRHIVGSSKADYLAGGGGNDTILGRGGNDTILGGAGNDLLEGGPGNDVIDGGPGRDRIFGGPGSDTIQDVDGEKETIDCGPGRDHAIVDKTDVVRSCELVTFGTPAATGTSGGGGSGTTGSEERVRR
jgi:Tol biopolymer transport system component